jgi:hypothetical protein
MVKLSLCLTNYALGHDGVRERGCISTSWRYFVSFTPLPLFPRGESSRCQFCRKLDGPRAGVDDVENRKFLFLTGLVPQYLCLPACSRSLYRRSYPGSLFTYKLHGQSPRPNYTDRATAACRRTDCQLLRVPRGQRDGSLRPYSRFF